ncbi:MAG TPA: amidohydrolase, partial [Gemmatimonadaceae bacterium]|nr:amidohydrolase [Gemmatimonadaceae bacterium]
APAGAWIRGGGWDQSYWGGDFPTAADLDTVSGGHPVLLTRIDGHATWANTRALRLAGITAATADPPGGRIVRGAGGAPAGVLVDDAIDLVARAVPPVTMPTRVARLRRALQQYARWGLTEVHDAGIDRATVQAYRHLAREGALPVRVYAMAAADPATLDDILPRGPVTAAAGTFTLRGVKIVDDGALGSRGARLAQPYSDDATARGFDLAPGDSLDRLIARARRRGFQVAVHAIGDAATTAVLDAIARAGTPAAVREARFRIEHASMIADRDLPRFAALGVIASMQPVFAGEYSRFAEARVGEVRLPQVLRTRDVLASGAVMAAGTDFPASDTGDPIATLDALVTRRGADGTPAGGWIPAQSVAVDDALRSMTVAPAWAAFEEREGGVLAVGRRADLTVLSADPYAVSADALRQLRVLQTIVGGRTVYRAR